MRYLGGKSRLAKPIVGQLPLDWADVVREPFMGGGAITAELARRMRAGQRLIAGDDFAPLVAMWVEAAFGWEPPEHVSEDDRRLAYALSDANPLKAFAAFGCGFGGDWNGSYVLREGSGFLCDQSRRSLSRSIDTLRDSAADVTIELKSFFDIEPAVSDQRVLLYCDPPYAGTTGYPTGAFDHERFWRRCREWRRAGARVFVSEFSAPDFATPVWQIERKIAVAGAKRKVDTLYEVQP